MPVKVVDASALAALLFGEPEADAVAERLWAPGWLNRRCWASSWLMST
jgi:uncharacterized protein with PIN domain